MPDRMSEDKPGSIPERMSEIMPDRFREYMPDRRMSEDVPDRLASPGSE